MFHFLRFVAFSLVVGAAFLVASCRSITNARPPEFSLLFEQGLSELEAAQYNSAITTFTRVISLAPDEPFAYQNRAAARFNLEQYQAALADYNTSLRLDDKDAYVYYYRGVTKYRLEDREGALADHNSCITHYTKDIADKLDLRQVYHGKAVILYQLEEWKKAIEVYTTLHFSMKPLLTLNYFPLEEVVTIIQESII